MEETKQHREQEARRQLGGPANGIGGLGTMGLGGGQAAPEPSEREEGVRRGGEAAEPWPHGLALGTQRQRK